MMPMNSLEVFFKPPIWLFKNTSSTTLSWVKTTFLLVQSQILQVKMLNFLLLVKKNMKKHELTIICHSPSGFSPAVARCDPATANVTGSKWTGPGKDVGESARAKRCGDDETPGATELGTEDDASGGIEHLGDLILMCIDDVYIYIYTFTHTYIYMYVCMYVCIYVHTHVSMDV